MNEIITLVPHAEEESIGVLHMRDDASKNTFTDEFVTCLMEKLEALRTDKRFKVVILRGLDAVFCGGASKQILIEASNGGLNVKDLLLPESVLNVPIPLIAAMEGSAVGGGFVLGSLCDIVLINERMMYGANFTSMGFTPGMGCTRLLQPLLGEYMAAELMYRGRLLKGREFRGRSHINYILPQDDIFPKAVDIAMDIAQVPRNTLEILKYSISLNRRKLLLDARVHEDFMHKISFAHPDVKKMIERGYNG